MAETSGARTKPETTPSTIESYVESPACAASVMSPVMPLTSASPCAQRHGVTAMEERAALKEKWSRRIPAARSACERQRGCVSCQSWLLARRVALMPSSSAPEAPTSARESLKLLAISRGRPLGCEKTPLSPTYSRKVTLASTAKSLSATSHASECASSSPPSASASWSRSKLSSPWMDQPVASTDRLKSPPAAVTNCSWPRVAGRCLAPLRVPFSPPISLASRLMPSAGRSSPSSSAPSAMILKVRPRGGKGREVPLTPPRAVLRAVAPASNHADSRQRRASGGRGGSGRDSFPSAAASAARKVCTCATCAGSTCSAKAARSEDESIDERRPE
mmetsp:Transcript_20617/g.65930  ORF Transcript_20617/g.65930 Transcript_20617/m.65930 type:complete len:334 (+) Transcript_20617:178-1179(+)